MKSHTIYELIFSDEGIFRYFQRVRNNEICEARGVSCKATMDLFEKNLRKPNPIPKDLYQDVSYTNNLNWLIMSSEGTGECYIFRAVRIIIS